METDPLGYVDSANLYSYVFNNPWNWVDPFGLYGGDPGGSILGGGIPGLGGGTGIPPAGEIPGSGGPIGGDGPEGGNEGGIPGLGNGTGIPPADDIPGTGGPSEGGDDNGDDDDVPGDNFPEFPSKDEMTMDGQEEDNGKRK